MSGIVAVVLIFFVLAGALGGVAYFTYKRKLRRAKAVERGLKMVPILIHLPPPSSDVQGNGRDGREVMREKTAQAEVLYNLIAGTATEGFKSNFYGQRHIALELIAINGVVHFFAAVPVALVSVVEKAIQTAYPGVRMEEVEDHNIFNQEGRLAATLGGEMVLREESAYPIATYAKLERDPMEALLTTISALEKADGVGIQIMLRPANPNWTHRAVVVANAKRKGRTAGIGFTPMDLAKALVKSPEQRHAEEQAHAGGAAMVSNLELAEVEAIEEKTKHPGFEVLIRVIVSTGSVPRSQQLLRDIATAFALFEAPGVNGFKFLPALDVQGLVTAFIFRFFPPELKSNVLNSVELATLFHLPDSQFTPTMSVERQQSKQVDGPVQLSSVGLLFGYNDFRGVKKEIRLSPEDRRRHTYVLGQTGTGKSTMLENLAVQDMLAGNGFAFIDPHGDSAEKLLALVPKERAEDVVYFNPADTQYPLGLNLFEFTDPTQKDFIVQETINMLYKLYDPEHTGIIGPRYEHWYRNAALTLMSDPNGSSFIEIPKVFTDTDYLKQKFKYLRDPTVIDFWTKEMGQTSDYHKSEMLGWFVSKFGAFQNNEMMRNIIGQTKSAFNIREIMDNKKILIVNLSKGRIGELNSQLLGMIFVIKFQAAAMSRADVPEDQRSDFSLYVDEFQNFSTDSFASILSEARKYRLNLIVANQFIGQLSNEIRDAVFGNIGTIVAHRMGPDDAEFMVKQFAPVFDAGDLVNIPNYNAAMRLMIGGLPSQPFTLRDSAPLGNPNLELGMAIKQLSAAKYGHAKAQVEADILDRFNSGVVAPSAAPVAVGAAPAPAVTPAPSAVPGAVVPAGVAAAGAPVAVPGGIVNPAPVVAGPVSVPVAAPVVMAAPVSEVAPAVAPAPVAAAAPVASVAAAPLMQPYAPQPIPAPAAPVPAAAPVSVADLSRMAAAPPPIGAPPVDLSQPQQAPVTATMPDMVVAPPVLNTAGQPMVPVPAIIPESTIEAEADEMTQAGGFNQLGSPLSASEPVAAAPAMAVAPPPIGAPMMTPPPIGAPPVDLPIEDAPAPRPVVASGPGTLSLNDITGGRPLPQVSRAVDPSSVPIMTPGMEPVPELEAVPVLASAPPAAAPMRPMTPLGSGQPREDDPYANIDVLGDLTPPSGTVIEPAPVMAETAPIPVAPVASGQPKDDDPYANIDVLGNTVEPAPVMAPYVPAAPVPEPVAAPESEPVLQPEPAPEPEPVMESEPELQPESAPVYESQLAPVSTVAAEPVPLRQPTRESVPAMMAAPPANLPAVASEPVAEPEPLAEPVPREQILAQSPATMAPEPVVEREVAPAPLAAPEPEPVAEPALVVAEEPIIHFTDPNAEAVLERPYESPAEPEPANGEPSLSGLPEGVQLVTPAAVVPSPVPAPVPVPPVAMTPVPAAVPLGVPLTNMAVTPPPIGAAPMAVAAPVVTPAPAPVAPVVAAPPALTVPAEAEIAHAAAAVPAPAMNAPLLEALEHAPVPLASAEPEAASADSLDKVESVADMLDEVHETVAAPESGTAPAEVAEAPVKAAVTEPTVSAAVPVAAPETAESAEPEAASQPVEPIAPAAQPAAAQIEKAEHEIDDLLSVSLIRPESTPTHRRLPEPVENRHPEDEDGVDMELNAGRPTLARAVDKHVAEHHGLKVIQPLEPIVPPREEFARELAAMNKAAAPAPAPASAPVKAAPVAPPKPASVASPAAPVPVPHVKVAPVKAEELSHVDDGISRNVNILPEATPAPVPPTPLPEEDSGMPEAVSLAADDVAKVKAEREAQAAMQTAPASAAEQAAPQESEQAEAPEKSTEVAPEAQKPADEAANANKQRSKRKRGGRHDKLAEHIESEAEAEHNKPTEAEAEVGSMTGKLILPTAAKPTPEPVQPKTEKPKKLAPGEVYVDESGNVIIGE